VPPQPAVGAEVDCGSGAAARHQQERAEELGGEPAWQVGGCVHAFLLVAGGRTICVMTTSVARVGDRALRVERVFDGTPERVWEVMTDPALIPQWWGPAHHDPTVVEMDVCPGGRWRVELTGGNGTVFGFSGEYLEVVAPHRLVQTFVFDPFPDAGTTESLVLEDTGGGCTVLRVDIMHPTPEGRDQQLASGMEQGMRATHDRLQALVAGPSRA
jgi:uncharacterized protein YndB with AHSA1/START domain